MVMAGGVGRSVFACVQEALAKAWSRKVCPMTDLAGDAEHGEQRPHAVGDSERPTLALVTPSAVVATIPDS